MSEFPDWVTPVVPDLMMTLGDGTRLKGYADDGGSDNNLWVTVQESMQFIEVVECFQNTVKTNIITSERGFVTPVYTGYTKLVEIRMENNGDYTVLLKKP